jgi:hypothetical protein
MIRIIDENTWVTKFFFFRYIGRSHPKSPNKMYEVIDKKHGWNMGTVKYYTSNFVYIPNRSLEWDYKWNPKRLLDLAQFLTHLQKLRRKALQPAMNESYIRNRMKRARERRENEKHDKI